MQFYKFTGLIIAEPHAEADTDRRSRRERARRISRKSMEMDFLLQGSIFFFVSAEDEEMLTVGMICVDSADLENHLDAFLRCIERQVTETVLEEVTLDTIRSMLTHAAHSDFIEDDEEILQKYGLDKLCGRFGRNVEYGENLIMETDKDIVYHRADRLPARDSFLPELDRIYLGRAHGKAMGHPVHYLVRTDDTETRKKMCRLLLQALYANERIHSKRYCYMDFRPGDDCSPASLEAVYKTGIGGSVIIRYLANEESEDDCAGSGRDTIETLCEVIRKYRNQVLTILCLPRECTASKALFYEELASISVVELKEELICGERARDFLRMLAADNGIRADPALYAALKDADGFLAPDLHNIFDEWYDRKLKTRIYPQYQELAAVKQEIREAAPRGSAYDELMEMVGLTEAKKVIQQALDYFKAQKLFAAKGMKADRPAMHMVFTGNPGTAKTSAARLFARIMKENDLLSKGHLVEVGRGDLVGKYVGWTAPTIQKKFREAQGGVLFIDEAYSLVDDRNGSYGDEAINTIVQEMENHRDDVVVIFAGYPDKMEGFMQKNPGLRSRIAWHVPFADYNTKELCDIAKLLAKQKGLTLTEDACEKLSGIFEAARSESDFGNGRYVRNVLEKARMTQSSRLLKLNPNTVSRRDVGTICGEDIDTPISAKPVKRQIGFSL